MMMVIGADPGYSFCLLVVREAPTGHKRRGVFCSRSRARLTCGGDGNGASPCRDDGQQFSSNITDYLGLIGAR